LIENAPVLLRNDADTEGIPAKFRLVALKAVE
jgi:hypothetical protein